MSPTPIPSPIPSPNHVFLLSKNLDLKKIFSFSRKKKMMSNFYDFSVKISSIPFLSIFFYTSILFFLLFFVFLFYLKAKYGFWVSQPVFHVYDFSYYFYPPGIIQLDLPIKNKYTNFKDIITTTYTELSSLHKTELVYFIQQHYLKNGENIYQPESKNIFPYFEGVTNHKSSQPSFSSFFTFYWEKNLVEDVKKGTVIENKKMIGCITSRPVEIKIFKARIPKATLNVNYVDYLCIDKTYRKKGIAPQLIQTHDYNQRHLNKEIQVSLFKREGELNGIIPLCVYTSYGFSVFNWGKPPSLPANYSLFELTKQNMPLLNDFLKETETEFDITMTTPFSNLLELIKSNNIYVYGILEHDRLLSVYYYRKSCVFIDKNSEVLTCYASIKSEHCPKDVFVQGFKNSFWNIADKNNFGFCAVENISHNHYVVSNLLLKNKAIIKTPTAYFFYNFAYSTFSAEKVFCPF